MTAQLPLALGLIASIGFLQSTVSERIRLAKEKPGTKVVMGMLGDAVPMSIEELTKTAPLVLEARVFVLKTYINEADTAVITDFAVEPIRVLAGQAPRLASSDTGGATGFVVGTYGGEVVKDGVTVRAENYTAEQLKDKGSYLLFLKPFGRQPGYYSIFNAAAFEIVNDSVRPLARSGRDLFKDLVGLKRDEIAVRVAAAAVR
jgi:hypothetical protein